MIIKQKNGVTLASTEIAGRTHYEVINHLGTTVLTTDSQVIANNTYDARVAFAEMMLKADNA